MKKIALMLLGQLAVAGSALGGFYSGARPIAKYFGISEYATGADEVWLLAIFLFCTAGGAIVGLFLYPLFWRPFLFPGEYWKWMGTLQGVQIPLLSRLLESWAQLLYGSPGNRKKAG